MMKQVNSVKEKTHTGHNLRSCVICNPYSKQICSSYRVTVHTKIGKIFSDDGLQKYIQLICLVKCILSLSHGIAHQNKGSQ